MICLLVAGMAIGGALDAASETFHDFPMNSDPGWTTEEECPPEACVPPGKILNLTGKMGPDGTLRWTPPPGRWVVQRIGYTTTGENNNPAGAGMGLECDIFNPEAARNVTPSTCHALQFHLEPRPNEVSRSVIIWRGSRADFRLVGRERLRDVCPGDEVIYQGRVR